MHRALLVLACVLHLVVGWAYAASGLVAPAGAVVVLVALWLASAAWLAVAVARRWRSGPAWPALLVPPGMLALLVVVVSAGGAALGWTA